MSAVATMKPGGQKGVQLTFPYVFQQNFHAGTSYFPSAVGESMQLLTGETFQSDYHRQKRADAIQNVYNGITNNASKELKLLTGTANYHLPKPVLGQRVFANPSLGALSFSSARRDGRLAPWTTCETSQTSQSESGMSGGVMKTREGFDYYTRNLQARIGQLNAMNAVATGMPVPRGAITANPSDSTTQGPPNKVEFFILLQGLQDAVTEGDLTRFTFENLKQMMGAMFNFGPVAEQEDFQDMERSITSILTDLRQGLDNAGGVTDEFAKPDYAQTLLIYMEGLKNYVDEMYANMNLSTTDRTTLSKSLVKTLGFTRLAKKKTPAEVIAEVRPENERVNQAAEDFDDAFDPNDGGDGFFNRPAEAREDDEQEGILRGAFAAAGNGGDPNRDAWGAVRAPGAREQEFAYFGAEEGEGQLVEPLAQAGVADQPERNPLDLATAVSNSIDSLLPGQGGAGPDIPRITLLTQAIGRGDFTSNNDFAEQVAADVELNDATITPQDITMGMAQIMDMPGVFNQYIDTFSRPLYAAAFPPAPLGPAAQTMAAQAQAQAQAQAPPPPRGPRIDFTREQLKTQLNTVAKAIAFANKMPESMGGPYRPRASSYLKTIVNEIVKRIQRNYPDF